MNIDKSHIKPNNMHTPIHVYLNQSPVVTNQLLGRSVVEDRLRNSHPCMPTKQCDWSCGCTGGRSKDLSTLKVPTVPIPDSPLEVFELFFSADLQQKIVDETNRYARQVMGDVRYSSWTKLTREELKAFIGFSMLMGINKLTHNCYMLRYF